MNHLAELLPISLAVVLTAMVGVWLLSLALRNASIADPFWGMGFVTVAWFTLISVKGATGAPRVWLLVALTTIWGLRLSLYLLFRNWSHAEDRRYQAMRQHHGKRFWWVSLLTVFWLQGVILWIVSMPIQVSALADAWAFETQLAVSDPQYFESPLDAGHVLGWMDLVGLSVWFVGFVFETVGDYQMSRFRGDPANAGRVMDRGLWQYTRHPNYFGDFCIWWGIYLIAVAGGAAWTIFSPLLMSFLLLKVSGVSLLEKDIVYRRPEYAAYQNRTSAFFPKIPR